MRAVVPIACVLLVSVACSGSSPTAPSPATAEAGVPAQSAASSSLSGSIFTFGGPPPTDLRIGLAGSSTVAVNAAGQFVLSGVPAGAMRLQLHVDGRVIPLDVAPFGTSQGSLQIDIRVDLGAGRAEVVRRCSVSTPPFSQQPGAPSASVTLCTG